METGAPEEHPDEWSKGEGKVHINLSVPCEGAEFSGAHRRTPP